MAARASTTTPVHGRSSSLFSGLTWCWAGALLAVILIAVTSCAANRADLGFGVTERDGNPELIVALCGQPPPLTLIVARGPSDGMPPWAEAPNEDDRIFQVDNSEWKSGQLRVSLSLDDAPPFKEGIWVVYDFGSRTADGIIAGSMLMPEAPWPTYPLALTTPSLTRSWGERPVRIDEQRDVCEEK